MEKEKCKVSIVEVMLLKFVADEVENNYFYDSVQIFMCFKGS